MFMRIAIIGASGQTGLQLIDAALARGHSVIGLARTPAKIKRQDPDLVARQADIFNAESLTTALAGADAVLTSVGKTNLREKTPPFNTTSHRNILAAMQANNIRRIVAISSFGAARGVKRKGLRRKIYLFLRRKYYGDMGAMEQMLLDADVDATVVRAPMLHNREARSDWLLTDDGSLPAGNAISRTDLAEYLIGELETGTNTGHIVAVADEGELSLPFSELRPPRPDAQ